MFNFCQPVSSKKRFLPFRKLDEQFSFSLFDRIEAVPLADWESITQRSTVFLEPAYLNIAECGGHVKIGCRYVIIYQHGKACGILYFQILDFKAGVFHELFSQQAETPQSRRLNLFEKYIDSNREEVLLRLFTCGNNLVSGNYGYRFDKTVSEAMAHQLMLKITDLVSREDKLKGALSALLLKDFHEPLRPEALFKEERYSQFQVEPNLIVEIPKDVASLNAYIELFSKKYRNRAKTIFKSLAGVELRELDLTGIRQHEQELYALYEEVFDKARFKLIKLPAHYFSSVKVAFKEIFTVKGFFREGKLIAFASMLSMPDGSVEAHYIGIHYALNQQHNLYQNILYTIIEEAIKNKHSAVNLGRTAAEIKTTVGAKPFDLLCYLRPQNTLSRLIQKPFISYLQPSEWTPRNPFKEEGLEKNNSVTVS